MKSKIRAKSTMKIQTQKVNYTHEWVKGACLKNAIMSLMVYVLVEESKGALLEMVEEVDRRCKPTAQQ